MRAPQLSCCAQENSEGIDCFSVCQGNLESNSSSSIHEVGRVKIFFIGIPTLGSFTRPSLTTLPETWAASKVCSCLWLDQLNQPLCICAWT